MLGLINISKNSNNPEEVKQYLTMMEGRVHHLDIFIHEIIDYSRNARLEIIKKKVNLNSLVAEVLESLAFSEGSNHLKIENKVPLNLEIQTDPNRLKIVLTNLISNSIRYSDPNKQPSYVLIEGGCTTKEAKLLVKDNGQGIASEHHAKIYDMFYRASNSSKGSGLGLYIVKESLSRIGGSIELSSEVGMGSVFTVTLPTA